MWCAHLVQMEIAIRSAEGVQILKVWTGAKWRCGHCIVSGLC